MSDRKFIIPEFGPFAGMRVVCSGSLVAMPFAATMLADFGAEVIQIERPGVGDTLRMLAPFADVNGTKVSTAWAQNARGAEPEARGSQGDFLRTYQRGRHLHGEHGLAGEAGHL